MEPQARARPSQNAGTRTSSSGEESARTSGGPSNPHDVPGAHSGERRKILTPASSTARRVVPDGPGRAVQGLEVAAALQSTVSSAIASRTPRTMKCSAADSCWRTR